MKDDYSYWSENLHSAYLFYTLEVDKLNKENKRLKTELKILINTNSKQEIYNVIHENTNFHKKNREVNQENKRLREALEKIAVIDSYKDCKNVGYEVDFVCCSKCQVNKTCIYYIAETTLRNTICD